MHNNENKLNIATKGISKHSDSKLELNDGTKYDLKEIKKLILEKEFGERALEITIYPSLLEKMNWSWDSLIFADNLDTFVFIRDTKSNDCLSLVTHGEVKIFNKDDESLDIDTIIKLAETEELYSENYFIDANNWFLLDFGINYSKESKTFEYIDDYVFEATPSNLESLVSKLVESFIDYFDR